MSKVITVYDAKTHLSDLIKRAASGEEIRIGKYGKPMAKLVADTPSKQKLKRRVPGRLAGKLWIAEDFDETPKEWLEAMDQSIDEDIAR